MRKAYIVAYDICAPKRLRKVYKVMLGYGLRVQYSVFRCELSRRQLAELRCRLDVLLDHHRDQILFIEFGPLGSQTDQTITSLGRAYTPPTHDAIVL